jgi:hypothetical protein
VCDVAEVLVARSVERQLMVDRQVVLDLAIRGADLDLPSVADVDAVLAAWLEGDDETAGTVDPERQVLLRALGVRT